MQNKESNKIASKFKQKCISDVINTSTTTGQIKKRDASFRFGRKEALAIVFYEDAGHYYSKSLDKVKKINQKRREMGKSRDVGKRKQNGSENSNE